MAPIITINGRAISDSTPPFIIAEMSANHNGSLDSAKEIIRAAKFSGADAVKLQSYTPDTITLNATSDEFKIAEGLWHGRTLYELYEEAHLPFEWHKPLFDYARDIGLTIFSTPFDKTAVDLLEDLNAPAYKIASFEATDLSLIKYVASTGKPLIISTGMTSLDEVEEAVEVAKSGGCKEIALLKCVSAYPALINDYNLSTIPELKARFGTLVGLSDHTLTSTAAITSVALGARLIEKHFTIDRSRGGPDDSFSIEPEELNELCTACKDAYSALGNGVFGATHSEKGNKQFRRSLYFCKPLRKGQLITEECIRSVRPGYGIPPKFFEAILGTNVTRDIKENTAVSWSDLVASNRVIQQGQEHDWGN